MLKLIRERIASLRHQEIPTESQEKKLRDAVATLLFALLLSDDQVMPEELAVIRSILVARFSMDDTDIEAYLNDLKKRSGESVSHYRELSLIREQCSLEERVKILDLCWQVAYADDRLTADEEHLVRRISAMLHIPHSHYIRTKIARQAEVDSL